MIHPPAIISISLPLLAIQINIRPDAPFAATSKVLCVLYVCMPSSQGKLSQPPNPHARVGRDVYLYWERVICVAKMRNVIIQTQSWRECRFGYHKLKKKEKKLQRREEKRNETYLSANRRSKYRRTPITLAASTSIAALAFDFSATSRSRGFGSM